MSLIIFKPVDNLTGAALSGVLLSSVGGPGPWQAVSNACGDCVTDLSPGSYSITFTKLGYADRVLPADLADPGIITVGMDRGVGPLPPIPIRDQVCALKTSLQGLTYHTTAYGDIPAWFYAKLNDTDRARARLDHANAGDTHIPISISAAYKEAGTLWPDELKQGYDYTQNLDALRAVCTEVITAGFFVDMPLAGDGMGDGPGYNDPVGNTYGYGWLMANLPRIIAGLKGDGSSPDLTPFIIFRPGWDGVFYGWEPEQVRDFGLLFRSLLPNGYLAIEHNTGHIPCGEGGADYAPGGLMRTYDTILSEFDTVHEDSCWQIVGRMVPHYHRPSDQPAGDDPNPPFYLAPGTERGPYFYVAFEPTIGGVYQWCRGHCTLAEVNAVRDYLRGLGCTLVG